MLTPGQRAAVRAAVARRGELALTQRELAQLAAVSARTIEKFERQRIWPTARTLAQIERLGLGWYAGYLSEYAARVDDQDDTRDETAEINELHRMIADAQERIRELEDRRRARGALGDVAEMRDRLDRIEPPGAEPDEMEQDPPAV